MTGPTNWSRYDVPTLARILDEDLSLAWDQVGAWRTTSDLVALQQARLAAARNDLADAWPPTNSPAAEAYLNAIDSLTASMDEAATAAAQNGASLTGLLTALETARTKVSAVHAQWQQTAQKMKDRNPILYSETPDWQSPLNAKAQAAMAEADQAIFEHSTQFRRVDQFSLGYNETLAPARSGVVSGTDATSPSSRLHGLETTNDPAAGKPPSGSTGVNEPQDPEPSQPPRTTQTTNDSTDIQSGSGGGPRDGDAIESVREGDLLSTTMSGPARRNSQNFSRARQAQSNLDLSDTSIRTPAAGRSDRQASLGMQDPASQPGQTPSDIANLPFAATAGGLPGGNAINTSGKRRSVKGVVPCGGVQVIQAADTPHNKFDPGPGVIGLDL